MPREGGASSKRDAAALFGAHRLLDHPLPRVMTGGNTGSRAMTDKMLAHKDGGVGTVTFNNPEKRNAVSLDMWEATKRILDDFAADPAIRVVVLTGAGGKAFVSGADISRSEEH